MISKFRCLLVLSLVCATLSSFAQAPVISYASPQSYISFSPIAPLAPQNTGGAIPDPTPMVIGSADYPLGVAVDGAGNVYIANGGGVLVGDENDIHQATSGITTIPFGTGTPVFTPIPNVKKIAVSKGGDLFVSDGTLIQKYPVGGGAPVAVGSGYSSASFLAVDTAGNVYFTDGTSVKKVIAGSNTTTTIASGFTFPPSITADAAGNIYMIDYTNSVIEKLPAGGGSLVVVGTVANILSQNSIAADNYGNVFVGLQGGVVAELPAGGGPVITLASAKHFIVGPASVNGIAVDGAGNLLVSILHDPYYEADDQTGGIGPIYYNNAIYEIKNGFYTISPTLPTGLSLDAHTGIISGTPTFATPAKDYTVTGYNESGHAKTTVNITVVGATPSISYGAVPNYLVQTPAPPLTPVNSAPTAAPFKKTLVAQLIRYPTGLAEDASGNIYVGSEGGGTTLEVLVNGDQRTTSIPDATGAGGVALDAAGNLYIIVYGSSNIRLVKVLVNGQSQILASNLGLVSYIAVDGLGNVYLTMSDAVKELPIGQSNLVTVASGFSSLAGIAVDPAGNIFVADRGDNKIKEIPAGGGNVSTFYSGLSVPNNIAIDASGNIYITDSQLKLFIHGSTQPIVLYSGTTYDLPSNASGLAVDVSGNVFMCFSQGGDVYKYNFGGFYVAPALPAGFSFDRSTGTISVNPYPTVTQPAKKYYIGAYDNNGFCSTSITLAVGSNQPADLINLAINTGTLNPSFTAGNLNYTALVSPATTSIGVTPTAADPNSTITINGTAATSGSQFAPLALATGLNTIKIVVTSQDGTSTKTYTLVVTRPSADASLSSLALNTGNLSPAFTPGTTSYNATVANAVTAIRVKPVSNESHAAITIYGTVVPSGGVSSAISLSPGNNVIPVVVTAQDGSVVTYSLNILRSIPANTGLSSLAISSGTLSPVFSTNQLSYSASVLNTTTFIRFTPAPVDPTATITLNGVVTASGSASLAQNLAVGLNVFHVTVTSQAGASTTYAVGITRLPSADATLSALSLNTGTLSPVFAPGTTAYTQTVANTLTSVRVKPVVNSTNATIIVNGQAVTSGGTSQAIALNVGANNVSVIVTAQDGVTTDTYKITVTRAGTANANLSALTISSGTLSPAFAAGTYSYADVVASTQTSVTVKPKAADPAATIKVNGTAVASGTSSAAISLTPGLNPISVVVTGVDGVTQLTYTITVNRTGSANASLAALTVSGSSLNPAFNANTSAYTVLVASGVTSVTITPTVAEAHATVTVNGATVASGTASAGIALHTGNNTITTIVTAQNGTTTDTYTITVNRAAATNANLFSLSLSAGTLSPAFDGGTLAYTASVSSNTASIKVTPTTTNPNATIKVNGTAVVSGSASGNIAIAAGSNTITIITTSEDHSATRTYTVTITKPSNNASLSALSLNSGSISPAFAAATTNYTASEANTVTAIRVKPTVAEAHATITVNGQAVTSGGTSQAISLAVGTNTVTTVVTAQDGSTTKTYTITVTRAAASPDHVDAVAVIDPTKQPEIENDGITVHPGVSPNGDGQNDVLTIDNIKAYPENSLKIMSRSGVLVYEAKGYDNSTLVFDGHSNKDGKMQSPGTYFYSLDYSVKGVVKHKTGFIVLKW